jgi:hypothetical protein
MQMVVAAASLLVAATAACTGGDGSSSSSSSSSSSGATSGSGGIADCPDDVPAACPPSPPTYAKDIAPLVQASCATCHAPGGRESSRLLTDYAHVYAQRGAVLLQVNACRMPPRDAPPISAEGRKALLAWLVCGAKND